MQMQMSFHLDEIDRAATKDKVEKALDHYKLLLLMDPEDYQPKITSSFKLVPAGISNQFSSTTEDVATRRVDMDKRRTEYISKINKAVNRLNYQERTIIINRYLSEDEVYDYEVYNDLGYSERKYYRIKSRAFYKLAFILRMEVYKEIEEGEAI